MTGALDQKDVLLPDILPDADEGLVVAELEDLALAKGYSQVVTNVPGQVWMGVTRKYLELVEERHAAYLNAVSARFGGFSW